MNDHDPLEPIRHLEPQVGPVPVGRIRARAEAVRTRRVVLASAGVAAAVAVALVGVRARTRHEVRDLASRPGLPTPAIAESLGNGGAADAATGADVQVAPAPPPGPGEPQTVTGSSGAPKAHGSAADSSGVASKTSSGSTLNASALTVRLELSATTIVPGQTVELRLVVCNPNDKSAGDPSPAYDFEVLKGRQVVWRYRQATGLGGIGPGANSAEDGQDAASWGPRECRTFTGRWDGRDDSGKQVAPGTYQAVGILTSQTAPPKRTDPKPICVTGCV